MLHGRCQVLRGGLIAGTSFCVVRLGLLFILVDLTRSPFARRTALGLTAAAGPVLDGNGLVVLADGIQNKVATGNAW